MNCARCEDIHRVGKVVCDCHCHDAPCGWNRYPIMYDDRWYY